MWFEEERDVRSPPTTAALRVAAPRVRRKTTNETRFRERNPYLRAHPRASLRLRRRVSKIVHVDDRDDHGADHGADARFQRAPPVGARRARVVVEKNDDATAAGDRAARTRTGANVGR